MRQNNENHFSIDTCKEAIASIRQEKFNEDLLFLLDKAAELSVTVFNNRITLFEEIKSLEKPVYLYRNFYQNHYPYDACFDAVSQKKIDKKYSTITLEDDFLNLGMAYPELMGKRLNDALYDTDIFNSITQNIKKFELMIKIFPKMKTTLGAFIERLINKEEPFNTFILAKLDSFLIINQAFPEYSDDLIKSLLKNRAWFHHLIPNVENLIEMAKQVKGSSNLLATFVLEDKEEFQRMITNADDLLTFVTHFTVTRKILIEILKDQAGFARIVREHRDLINLSKRFPEMSIQIMDSVIGNRSILRNVITNMRQLINTLKFLNTQIYVPAYEEATEKTIYPYKYALICLVLRDLGNFQAWIKSRHDVHQLLEYLEHNPKGIPSNSIKFLIKVSQTETFEEALKLIEWEEIKDALFPKVLACSSLFSKLGRGNATCIIAMTAEDSVDFNKAYRSAGKSIDFTNEKRKDQGKFFMKNTDAKIPQVETPEIIKQAPQSF